MWHTFKLQVDGQSVVTTKSLADLRDEVFDWVARNKTGTVKICLLDGVHGRGAVEWDSLHDVITFGHLQIKFRSQRDASLFKLFFSEHITSRPRVQYDPVILPIIRRVMPSILVADICGVQPMTGPVGSIFRLQTRYRLKKLTRKQKLAKRAREKAERKAARFCQPKTKKNVIEMKFKESTGGSMMKLIEDWRKAVQP